MWIRITRPSLYCCIRLAYAFYYKKFQNNSCTAKQSLDDVTHRERIIGWIKWSDVAAGPKFQMILRELRQIMQGASNLIII